MAPFRQVLLGVAASAIVAVSLPWSGNNVPAELMRTAPVAVMNWRAPSLEEVESRSVSRPGGYIDHIAMRGGWGAIEGWAADVRRRVPAIRVHVFVDGEPVAVLVPDRERPDVAQALGASALARTGFIAFVPPDGRSMRGRDVRVFARLQGRRYSELKRSGS